MSCAGGHLSMLDILQLLLVRCFFEQRYHYGIFAAYLFVIVTASSVKFSDLCQCSFYNIYNIYIYFLFGE